MKDFNEQENKKIDNIIDDARNLATRAKEAAKGKGAFIRRIFAMSFTLLFLIPIGITLIVDLHLNSELTWSLYPIISLGFVWAFGVLPLFFSKWRFFYHVIFFVALVVPFVVIITELAGDYLFTFDVFLRIGVGILSILVIYFIFAKGKFNIGYKLFFTTLALSVNHIVDIFIGRDTVMGFNREYLNLGFYIATFVHIIVALSFLIVGYALAKNKKRADYERK